MVVRISANSSIIWYCFEIPFGDLRLKIGKARMFAKFQWNTQICDTSKPKSIAFGCERERKYNYVMKLCSIWNIAIITYQKRHAAIIFPYALNFNSDALPQQTFIDTRLRWWMCMWMCIFACEAYWITRSQLREQKTYVW